MFASSASKKDDLLAEAQSAREARRLLKKQESSAVTLQAAVRGFLAVRRLLHSHSSKCEEVFPGKKDHVAICPAVEQFWCIRWCLFTGHCKRNGKRLQAICHGVLSSMSQASPPVWYVSMVSQPKLITAWIGQMKKLCTVVMQRMAVLKPWTANDGSAVSLYLRILVAFTDCTGWQLTAKASDTLQATLKKLCARNQKHLLDKGLYYCLRELGMNGLCRDPIALSGAAILSIVSLALRPLSSSGYSIDRVKDFATYILSLPGLLTHLKQAAPQGLVLLERYQVLKHVVNCLANRTHCDVVFNELHIVKSACLLGNLVDMYTAAPQQVATDLRQAFLDSVCGLIDNSQQYTGQRKGNTGGSSSFHQLLGWFQLKGADDRLVEGTPVTNKQIEKLWCDDTVNVLFGDVIAGKTDTGKQQGKTGASGGADGAAKDSAGASKVTSTVSPGKKSKSLWERFLSFRPIAHFTGSFLLQDSPEARSLRLVCSLYHGCINAFQQVKMEILSHLCFHPGLLPSLWHYLSCASTLDMFSKASHDEASIASHPLLAVLSLFCDCCTHVMAIVDDLEMYEEQRPFTLDQLILMSGFLNKLCFNLVWHAGSAAKTVPATGTQSSMASAVTVSAAAAKAGVSQVLSTDTSTLLSAAHSLLMLLHDRDCRKAFAAPDHWIVDSLPLSSFKHELQRGQQRATTLLRMMPHVIPYLERAAIFRDLVAVDKHRLDIPLSSASYDPHHQAVYISVRRSALLEDGFSQLSKLSMEQLKGVIRIKFVNEQGLDEAGIDQDGVFKEFLEEIVKLVFDPNFALFKSVEGGDKVYPSPNSYVHDNHLNLFDFVGRLLAKAVYEGIVIEVPFASFFLTQLLGRTHSFAYSSFDELSSLDPELYRHLSQLKRYDGDVEEDFCLTFAIDTDSMGTVVTHDLKPGGSLIPVTDINRISYIHLVADFKLRAQIRKQSSAFCTGFRTVIHPNWLVMFSPPELQRLISGDNRPLDVADLKKYVLYLGGFNSAHSVIRWLWDVVEKDFDAEEKGLFLKFVTSCSKPPVLGFAHLQPPFSIRLVDVSDDEDTGDSVVSVFRSMLGVGARARQSRDRLPTASTCFNMLKLPNYSKKAILRDKLRYSIRANAGFELS